MENKIPKGWEKIKLGDVVEHVKDKVHNREEWTFDRYIGGEHFEEGEIRITKSAPIEGNEGVIGSAFHMRFKPGQVLYVTRNPRLRKGGMVDFEGVCSNVTFTLQANEEKLSQKLLPFIIQTESFTKHACNSAHGSTNPFLNWKDIASYDLLLPPLNEQKKIAEVLWAVEEAIKNNEGVIKKFELFRLKTMKEVLTKGIGKQNYIESELGLIPKGWNIKKISDICNIRRGASPRPINDKRFFSNSGPGWIRIADVTPVYKYLKKTTQYLSELGASKSVRVMKGDLIMSICATIGKPVIIDMDACIHDGFVLFSGIKEKEILMEYLFYVLLFKEKEFLSNKQVGTQGNLNTSIVGNIKLGIPPSIDEQKKIVDVLVKIDNGLFSYKENLKSLKALRQKLMNELFLGKIRLEK